MAANKKESQQQDHSYEWPYLSQEKPVPSVQPIPRSESCHQDNLPLLVLDVILINPPAFWLLS